MLEGPARAGEVKAMPKIYLVGAGPGRADLLTLRAARILAGADCVLYDRLVSGEVLSLIRPGAELHDVGKEEGRQEAAQDRIYELLEDCARRFNGVVRLKGGDPFVFGRGAEEWAWLIGRGWDVEAVPGVSASLSVPALAGIPPTFRGLAQGFAVVTGHVQGGAPEYWARYAAVDTLVILMGVKNRAAIAGALIAAGRPAAQPAAFIENGTTPRERVVVTTLGEVAAGRAEVSAPAVFVAGEVVRLRAALVRRMARLVA
jgi:uroporphyrin-III C-methyltransferase